jgi:hypothetical protein
MICFWKNFAPLYLEKMEGGQEQMSLLKQLQMAHEIKNVKVEEALKNKSNEQLEKELKVLMVMSNGGGLLADDIINELDRRSPKNLSDTKG